MTKYYYIKRDQNPVAVLKWLRTQGDRGVDWDFTGGLKGMEVWFKNSKLELAYTMRWQWVLE